MGSVNGGYGASKNLNPGTGGLYGPGTGGVDPLTRPDLKLVRDYVTYGPDNTEVTGEKHGVIDYPFLQGAVELGLTEEEHGQFIVDSNAAFHPETD